MRPHDPDQNHPDSADPDGPSPTPQEPGGRELDGMSDHGLAASRLPDRKAPAVPAPRVRSALPPADRVSVFAAGEMSGHVPTGLDDTDDRDLLLLLETARRHIGLADVHAVNCLSAAADALTDPRQPPALRHLADIGPDDTADLGAVATEVRARMLAPDRPGNVSRILARGYAARELTAALEHLTADRGALWADSDTWSAHTPHSAGRDSTARAGSTGDAAARDGKAGRS